MAGGFAPGNCGCLPQQGRPLKRAPCTPPKLYLPKRYPVTVCDDDDGIFDTAPTHGNIVTPSHIVTTAPPLQALQCARSDCGCFRIECRTHSAAALR